MTPSPGFAPGPMPIPLTWIEEIGSTQVELVTRARAGASEQALATTSQTAGHGRRGREWWCPPGSGLAMSVLIRPACGERWTWLPLLAGIAVVDALESLGASGVSLKWPNDVLTRAGKLAGLLAERVDPPRDGPTSSLQSRPAFVVGFGLNLTSRALPPGAACVDDLGVDPDAGQVAEAVLGSTARWVRRWVNEPASVATAYRERCTSIGQDVRVHLPGGAEIVGEVAAVDDDGCLVLAGPAGRVVVPAGDVVHLRAR